MITETSYEASREVARLRLMATRYLYKCTSCDLEGVIAGKPSANMSGPTNTFYCEACNSLPDTQVYELLDLIPKEAQVCEECETPLVEWQQEMPCPKCKGEMTQDDRLVIHAD